MAFASENERSFVDQNGRIIPAEALSVSHGKVALKLKDGPTVQVPLALLCQVDQIYLRDRFPNAAFVHQEDVTLEWKTSIGAESGRIRKVRNFYEICETQAMAISLTNREPAALPQMYLGLRVYLADSNSNLIDSPAVTTLLSMPILQPRQPIVLTSADFAVSDLIKGPTPDLRISQEQRKKVLGVVIVLFDNNQPVYQMVSPGLEEVWKKVTAAEANGVTVPLLKHFTE